MAKRIYIGNAEAVPQIRYYDLTGTFGEGAYVRAVCGDKTILVKAPAEVFDETGPEETDPIDDTAIAMFMLSTLATAINAEVTGEFAELEAVVSCTMGGFARLIITGELGHPFTVAIDAPYPTIDVDTTQEANVGTDQVDTFYFTYAPTEGTYTISADFGSGVETSDPITYNATTTVIRSAMAAGMASVALADIAMTGTGTSGDPYVLSYGGSLADTVVTDFSVGSTALAYGGEVTLTNTRAGSNGAANASALVSLKSTNTGCTLRVNDNVNGGYVETAELDLTTTPAQLQTIFDNAIGAGNAVILGEALGTGSTFLVTLQNDYGGHNYQILPGTQDTSYTTYVTGVQTGGSSWISEIYTIEVDATGGTIEFTYGAEVDDIAYSTIYGINAYGEASVKLPPLVKTEEGSNDFQVYAQYGVTNSCPNFGVVVMRTTSGVGGSYAFDPLTIDDTNLTGGAGTATLTKVQDSAAVITNALWECFNNGTAGTLALTMDGAEAGGIAFDEPYASLESLLEGTWGVGNVNVTAGDGSEDDPWLIELDGAYAGEDGATITGNGGALVADDPLPVTGTTTAGGPAVGEVWRVVISDASGGTFQLGYGDKWTTAIAFGANAATVQAAMEALPTVGAGNMTVSGAGTSGDPYIITALNDLFEGPLYQVQVENKLLTGTSSITVNSDTIQEADGPLHWDNAANWVNPATGARGVPVTGDDVYIDWGNSTRCLRYDLDQSAVDFNSIHVFSSFTDEAWIGNARRHVNDFYEYRELELQVGLQGDKLIRIGYGEGGGSPLVNINSNANETRLEVYGSSSPVEGERAAVQWRGTHADNVVYIYGGSVGLGVKPGHTTTVKSLYINDGSVYLGEDCTITDNVQKFGGDLITDKAALTSATIELVA